MKNKTDKLIMPIVMICLTQSFVFLAMFQGLSMQIIEEKQDSLEPWLYDYIHLGYIIAIPMLAFSIIVLVVSKIPDKQKIKL